MFLSFAPGRRGGPVKRITLALCGLCALSSAARAARPALTAVSATHADGFIDAPTGRFHQSCVFEVPSGSRIKADGTVTTPSGEIARVPPCTVGPAAVTTMRPNAAASDPTPSSSQTSWIEATAADISAQDPPIVSMDVEFRIPPPPAQWAGQLIYLFPAFESANGDLPASSNFIVQPVLAYGYAGQQYWTLAHWVVDGNNKTLLKTEDITDLNVGELIHTSMRRVGPCVPGDTSCFWRLDLYGDHGNQSLISWDVNFAAAPIDIVVGGALEAYHLSGCGQLPQIASVDFQITFMQTAAGDISPSALQWHGLRFPWPFDCAWKPEYLAPGFARLGFDYTMLPPPVCVPRLSCAPGECGVVNDGCGRPLTCPPCCVPRSCDVGACGVVSDGCGSTLACGGCSGGAVCSGHVCRQPATCGTLGASCGAYYDGLGGTVQCGGCPTGMLCSQTVKAGAAQVTPGACCAPTTCAAKAATCGEIDNCGRGLKCGTCPAGQHCPAGGNVCVAGAPQKVPATGLGASAAAMGLLLVMGIPLTRPRPRRCKARQRRPRR